MKLWIRSQDKKRLCLIKDLYIHENIRYKDIEETEIIKTITGDYFKNKVVKKEVDEYINCEIWGDKHLLGIYKTREKGLEVLDEIQETICLDKFNYEDTDKTCYQDCYRYKSDIITVYEMPKEEEND